MKNLSALTVPERVVCAAGALFAIDLLFLPFHSVGDAFVRVSLSGVDAPDGFLGWLSVILVAGLVAVIGLRRLTDVTLPEPAIGWGATEFAVAILAVALMLLKLVLHLSYLGFGAWAAVVLGVALGYGVSGIRRQAGPSGASRQSGLE